MVRFVTAPNTKKNEINLVNLVGHKFGLSIGEVTMQKLDIKELYYITHINNLRSILARGVFFP